jgi:hypothetical protein
MERLANRFSQRLIGAIIHEPNAISNAINCAKFFSRSYDTVIRVYDGATVWNNSTRARGRNWKREANSRCWARLNAAVDTMLTLSASEMVV